LQPERAQAPWRSFRIGVSIIGAPAAISYIHPTLGLSLFITQAVTLMIVFAAALFGTQTISDRAFRLLRWLASRPEPAAPPSSTSSAGPIFARGDRAARKQ
jgi:hypothetical protein